MGALPHSRSRSHLGGVTTSSIIPPNDARHELTYTGPISGAAVMAKVMDRTIDGPSGLLDLGIPTGVAAYMFWASDGKEIHVMENPHSRAPFFYVLKPKL
jgi:hypothetical protein